MTALETPARPRLVVDDDLLLDKPNRRPRVHGRDLADVGAAILTGAAAAEVLQEVLGWKGTFGFGVTAYLFFLAAYYLLQRDSGSDEAGIDRVVTVIIWSMAASVVAVLGWMLLFVVVRGLPRLTPSFFSNDMSKTGPLNPGGGAKAAIIGTAEQVGMATLVVVPLAVLTAIYLHELRGRLAGIVRFSVNALAGFPAIVAGLVVLSVWVVNGHGYSGAAGSAALAILMLPFVTRASEEILRTVPDSLREASLALGAPQWKVVTKVVVPTARAGLTTAVILGVALGVGETAPLLLTTSYSNTTVVNPFKGPQASLPYFINNFVREPSKVQNQRGYTALLILILLVLALFVIARVVGGLGQRKLGRTR